MLSWRCFEAYLPFQPKLVPYLENSVLTKTSFIHLDSLTCITISDNYDYVILSLFKLRCAWVAPFLPEIGR